jgi:hypothetical protein
MHTTLINSIHLITDLQSMELKEFMKMCSFDIKNMYTNIPKSDVIIKHILKLTRSQ